VKHNQRLGYQRLAEVLMERGLVEPQAVRDALEMSARGGLPFPEALVTANLVADWELSRTVCEVYNLPFLTVEMVEPNPEAFRGIDLDFLRQSGVLPVDRMGQVLTVCMPAIVPAEVLGFLAAETDCIVLPMVGTVRTNRRWLEEQLSPASPLPAAERPAAPQPRAPAEDWSQFFDEADAAVLSDIWRQTDDPAALPDPSVPPAAEAPGEEPIG